MSLANHENTRNANTIKILPWYRDNEIFFVFSQILTKLSQIEVLMSTFWYLVLHYSVYSGHKSCISQDARLYFARLVSQDFSCKTCKTKIYLSTLFFWLKLEVFSQKIKLGLTKKFFILSFVTFIQKNTLF